MENVNILIMKSKKTEGYLKSLGGEKYYSCKYDHSALNEAVEVAKQEMIEKAIRVFCKTVCGGRDDSNSCKSCSLVKTFVDELNK